MFVLYAFVRVADNFVDDIPQDECGFQAFAEAWERAECGDASGDPIIDDYVELSHRRGFDADWTRAFLAAMASDLGTVAFDRLEDTLAYVYGSAEVIGLFMARLLSIPEKALPHARLLGRAMQYINFLRDIAEDVELGRRYLPLSGSGLQSLEESEVRSHEERFVRWFREQSLLYRAWHEEAARGYAYIPRRYRLPIQTAEDMYLWTASLLEENPMLVYERKVKPPRNRIRRRAFINLFAPGPRLPDSPVDPDIPGGMAIPRVMDFSFVPGLCEDPV